MSDIALVMDVDAENPIPGDVRLVGGQIVLTTGDDAIRQDLQVRLRWFLNEWFLDKRTGVPWFQQLIGQPVSDAIFERVIRRVITTTPGVARIEQFALVRDALVRNMAVNFRVVTANGTTLTFTDFILFPTGES